MSTKLDLHNILPPSHTYHLQNNAITVFDENKTSFKFAAQIATLKSTQANSEPFYVMNTDRLNELLDVWTMNLPLVQPFYSANCNIDPVLLRILAVHPSMGFNCTNQKELETVLDFASPERVLCSNPCWTRNGLRQTAEQDIQLLSFESDRDLDRILSNHPNANLILHICANPESEDPNALFGCAPDKAPALLQLAIQLGLNCVGISFSIGADCIRPSLFAEAIELSASLFQIGTTFGHHMTILNIGDGFSGPLNEYQYSQFGELCSHINQQLSIHGFDRKNIRVMATPGRFFAGSVYSLITNVIEKRPVDASFVTNNDFDAGNEAYLYQINEGYYGSFGCRIMANSDPQCSPLFDDHSDFPVLGTVIGPMGFEEPETDVVQQVCQFRQLDIGDWLIWANMGAYTFGNRGSLEDDDELHSHEPAIFYFATRKNWDRLARDLFGRHSFDDTGSDAGSCGEATMHTDTEDETENDGTINDNRREEEEDIMENDENTAWVFEWSIHSAD